MQKMYYNGQMVNVHEDINFLFPVYEVIRVVDGNIHFLDEHLRRLERSWNLSDKLRRKEYIGYDRLAEICRKVVEENELNDQNIRIDIDGISTVVKPVESFYPSSKEYETGVDTITTGYTRSNPNAKIHNVLLRERVRQIQSIENVFEVLLVDEAGQILEGSKSNVFFMKGNTIHTAPIENVLGGVTREVVLQIVHDMPELRLYLKPVNVKDIFKFDCCFLTGTSIDLLPIRRIDSQTYHSASNQYFKQLLEIFRDVAASG
ncbi:MAG: aminotransferase class IV [Bacillota bacterium]|nr:aminotransferase class IV [Bacillota bacterium]